MLRIRSVPPRASLLYISKEERIVSFDGVDTRRHPRQLYSDTIEFCLNPSRAGTKLHGITINISDSGIGLYVFAPVYEGQTVTIKTALPVPYQKATVIWVQKRAEELYRAGFKFITVREPAAELSEERSVLIK
jgi:hypothetical protein